MSILLIDGVTIEPNGLVFQGTGKPRWIAYRNGVCANNQLTPMLAYLMLLKAESEQYTNDLYEEYNTAFRSYSRMMEVSQ